MCPNLVKLLVSLLLCHFNCVSTDAEERSSDDVVMELETNKEATNGANPQTTMWAQDTGVDLFP